MRDVSRVVVLRASDEGGETTQSTTTTTDANAPSGGGRFKRRDPSAAPPRPSPLGSGPAAAPPSGIKVIPVEQRSRDAFQGVAQVNEVTEPAAVRNAKLVAGDTAALLVFAAIGRGNHGGGEGDREERKAFDLGKKYTRRSLVEKTRVAATRGASPHQATARDDPRDVMMGLSSHPLATKPPYK